MPITAKYFQEEPVSNVIGPQLGPIFDSCGVRISIAVPDRQDKVLTCILLDAENTEVREISSNILHEKFRHFLFKFENLDAGKKYFYKFKDNDGQEIDLQGGLNYRDCWFYAPEFKDADKFILLSCNNPFHSEKQGDARWTMWNRLFDVIEKDTEIKFLIQGGDQIYNDDIEADCLQKLKKDEPDIEGVQENIIRNYKHYYGNLKYRQILARMPSLSMLDDHDITDGWGGRPEGFDAEKKIRPEWQTFFDISYDAFKAYQTIKNPELRLHEGVETTYMDFGQNRLYLLDLRKEKNVNNEDFPLVSTEHEKALHASLEDTSNDISNILVLSPVVPVRINPKEEETLGGISTLLYELRSKSKIKMRSAGKWQWAWQALHFLSGLGGVADLTDDLNDGLSSLLNRRFLVSVLEKLATLANIKGQQAYILSGDIHTAGISEIFIERENKVVCIPQIVSSPVGYAPMKKLVKDKTTEEVDYKIILPQKEHDNKLGNDLITARNIFYKSDRNFAVVSLSNCLQESAATFYFESLKYPLTSPVTFWKT